MSYPADYGFIEGTMGEDGDPLDALVLVGEPTFPGCRIRVRVVGVFHMTDEKGPDEKVICVPLKDPAWMRVSDIHDIPPEFRDEIEHFFQVYKDLEEGKTETRGFGNRADAEADHRRHGRAARRSLTSTADRPTDLQPTAATARGQRRSVQPAAEWPSSSSGTCRARTSRRSCTRRGKPVTTARAPRLLEARLERLDGEADQERARDVDDEDAPREGAGCAADSSSSP